MSSSVRCMFRVVQSVCVVLMVMVCGLGAARAAQKPISYEKSVLPVLQEYCFGCHGNGKKKGDLALDTYKDLDALVADRKTWESVLQNLNSQAMPPENKKQPSLAQRELLTTWIQSEIFQCDCSKPDPGRVTIRRLNRTEYNNTIHDLVGVDFQPAEDFPQDDTGYGFDNIGDVLSLSPVLLEKYMTAAQKILDTAIMTDSRHVRRPIVLRRSSWRVLRRAGTTEKDCGCCNGKGMCMWFSTFPTTVNTLCECGLTGSRQERI
jgi:hypothetical protein